jgi:hypothetical protein
VVGTYQEALLSRRRLIFSPSQVSFQCLKTCTCEAIPLYLKVPQDYGNSAYHADKISDMMQGLPGPLEVRGSRTFAKEQHASSLFRRKYLGMRINEYIKKSLSYESDTLNAIMGVLRYAWLLSIPIYHFWGVPFKSLVDDQYDADFLSALFWVPERNDSNTHLTRREMFPSWTWAGWRGLGGVHLSSVGLLEGGVSLITINGTSLRLRDYVAIMRKTWNMYDFKPILYITGWFAMVHVEMHVPTRWVVVGSDDNTNSDVATPPFANVGFMASSLRNPPVVREASRIATETWPAIIFMLHGQTQSICGLLLKSVDGENFERVGQFSTDEWDHPGQTNAHATSSRVGNDIEFIIPALRGYEGEARLRCSWHTIKLV